jgi:hypothetical protein
MKIKLTTILLFILIAFSCKNQNKENNSDLENQSRKTTKKTNSQDTTKREFPLINSSTNDITENRKLLLDFYKKNEQKPQFFLINNNKDTTIVCNEKTRIKIIAQCFVSSKTGKDILGNIQIAVSEYYTISEIILANLTTTTNGKLLETGGMINITASSNQEKCDLKKGKTIEIEFPRKEEKKGMQLYTGNKINNAINWEVLDNAPDLNQIFSKVDQEPIFPGGVDKMYQFIGRSVEVLDENISGRIYSNFTVDKEGNVTNVKIIKGLGKEIDAEVIRVLKSLPKFIPGKINGIPVNVSYNMPIQITAPEEIVSTTSSGQNTMSKKQFERKYDNDEKLQKAKVENISYYLFSSTKLGFINCDRLWQDNASSRIDYVLNFNNNSETKVNIVFHSVKSIISEFSKTSTLSFNNIPSNEKITIFAVKYFEKKPFLAIKETETSEQGENNLVFQPVTMEILKSEIKKLDRFN